MLIDDADFRDADAAVAHAKGMAKELIWDPDLIPGSKLLVVDDVGETIAEIPLVRPPH